jgi:hypothetical protein
MAELPDMIVEKVKECIAEGLAVYGRDGHKLGVVHRYDTTTGWMKVAHGRHTPRHLYIPFSAVTSIDPREIYLSLSRDELLRDYGAPPPRTTLTEQAVWPERGETIALTSEPSGYDGAPVVVDRVALDVLLAQITPGMHVNTHSGEAVGTITRYDPRTGGMLVEKGVLTPHDLYLPITVVQRVDHAAHTVYLAVGTEDLQRLERREVALVFFTQEET